jgi:hypothetical protein
MSDNIDTARTFLSENRLRMTLSADGGRPWYVVKGADGSLVAEGPSYVVAVKRARTALRKQETA